MRPRPGMTLAECLVALALAGVVSAAVGSVLMTQNRLLRAVTTQAADADARRITSGVLRAELRWLDPIADIRSIAGDSIAVRLYRGAGSVCAVVGDRVLVRHAGARLPAPGKDSVIVRGSEGELVSALTGFEPAAPCNGDTAVWLRLDPAPPASAALVLLFESGTYYLRDHALRYRLGSEGRQPITDERFAGRLPAVMLDTGRGAAVVPLAWPDASARHDESLRFRFANAAR